MDVLPMLDFLPLVYYFRTLLALVCYLLIYLLSTPLSTCAARRVFARRQRHIRGIRRAWPLFATVLISPGPSQSPHR